MLIVSIINWRIISALNFFVQIYIHACIFWLVLHRRQAIFLHDFQYASNLVDMKDKKSMCSEIGKIRDVRQ